MDITPQDNTTTQPISDDQELAKALAGVSMDEPEEVMDDDEQVDALSDAALPPALPSMPAATPSSTSINVTSDPTAESSSAPAESALPTPGFEASVPAVPAAQAATGGFGASSSSNIAGVSSASSASSPTATGAALDLSSIKGAAIQQLRPLMSQVDLPPEEKFDTYLMLIRSTDDASLIEPAHAAAQGITDEKRKAEALLEVIREIDYLSKKNV